MPNQIKVNDETVSWTYPTGHTDKPQFILTQKDGAVSRLTQDEYSQWIDRNEARINISLGLTADGKEIK